jgi:hypothetical protein
MCHALLKYTRSFSELILGENSPTDDDPTQSGVCDLFLLSTPDGSTVTCYTYYGYNDDDGSPTAECSGGSGYATFYWYAYVGPYILH